LSVPLAMGLGKLLLQAADLLLALGQLKLSLTSGFLGVTDLHLELFDFLEKFEVFSLQEERFPFVVGAFF
jgi:hypothetical protein